MRRCLFLVLVASVAISACEGARNNTSWSDRKEGTDVVPDLQKAPSHDAATADSAAADTSQVVH